MEFVKPFNHITLFIKYDGTTTGSDTIRQDCNIHRIQEKIGVGGWDTVSIATSKLCSAQLYVDSPLQLGSFDFRLFKPRHNRHCSTQHDPLVRGLNSPSRE